MIENHAALVGTPEEAADQLRVHHDHLGEHEPALQINFGGIPEQEALRTLELFAARVMPKFAV
jgi:alkanesulfonate monooxygenase SsuD/methylene tetrahydromethanopterin reductase-like flavin-dependent oxidoreductase (luciferase family)